jgi:carbon-monoxide dehydrogenase large subunit
MPGVRLILTAEMLAEAGLDFVPVDIPPPGRSFDDWEPPAQPILARGQVRFVGEIVAFVVADTANQGRDAAEALNIQFEDLPPILDVRRQAPIFEYEEGEAEAVASAMTAAVKIVRATILNNRIDAAPIEPRGCIGCYEDERFTLYVSTQRVQIIQRSLADRVFRIPRERIRVVGPDTGGGFGQKNGLYSEYVLCLEAARRLRRPVKWIPDRAEALSGDCHGRDNLFTMEAGINRQGQLAAIRATRLMNMGAYASSRSMVPVQNGITHLTGVYAVPVAHVSVRGVLTNTAPTCSYRGAGRPENVFCCERLIDIVARTLGRDPIEFRRANLIKSQAMPWISPLGTTFDSHNFADLLNRALSMLDYESLPARRTESAENRKLRGFGVSLFAEDLHGSAEPIPARLTLEGELLHLIVGTGSAGHGHETSFLQITAETLELPLDRLAFRQSDTDLMSDGLGTAASWSMTLGGSSVRLAADAAVRKASEIAANILEASVHDILLQNGHFKVSGTDLLLEWDDIFCAEPNFFATGSFEGTGRNVPAGCHGCEVEVDPDTGLVTLVGYSVAQDSGVVINPMIFEGQIHGGVAQGVGQGWLEEISFDAESGQLLSGSFTDYALPRASDLPLFYSDISETAAVDNPLGVKGVGESGATGSTPAFVNAVLDALWPFGIINIDPPLTSQKIWTTLCQARHSGEAENSLFPSCAV